MGNIYISDNTEGVRKIGGSTGVINFVGAYGGYMCFDAGCHNLYFSVSTWIKRLHISTGILDTVAGTGIAIYNGDDIPATAANFQSFDVGIDDSGHLYITDAGSDRIRMIDGAGIIHTVAGTGVEGYNGDGIAATTAQLWNPEGIAFDACGNMYIGDVANNRVRKVTYLANPHIAITAPAVAAVGSTITVTAIVAGAGHNYIINWYNRGVFFTTTTVPVVSYTKTAAADSITATLYGCSDSAASNLQTVWDTEVSVVGLSPVAAVHIWPNPVGVFLHINCSLPCTYALLELTGRTIASGALPARDNTIPVGNLTSGIYLLRVQSATDRYIYRVVKE